MSKGTFLFLGTGASTGIPMIGCSCPVCTSKDPYNQRLRPSGLLTLNNKKLLIDTGPDLRTQALRYGINHLDGVLLTHTHYDHIAGLDELRTFYLHNRTPVPVLISQTSMENVKKRYDYLFVEKKPGQSLTAQLDFHIFEHERGSVTFLGIPITYLTYGQGGMRVNGYRIGNFAYVSDIRDFPESVFEDLEGVKCLVLSALRDRASAMHLTFEEATLFAEKVNVDKTWLTHIAHEADHNESNAQLPDNIALAYDGLSVEFSYE